MTDKKTLQELQEQYAVEIGKLPNNKKNDIEWIQSKLDEFHAGKEVDSTPDEDGNPTPEEWMITKAVETPKEVPADDIVKETVNPVEVPKPIPVSQEKSVAQIQSFYGITNEELYDDNILTKKFKLSPDEIKAIRTFTEKSEAEIDLNLNYYQMPDYIQTIFHKYGFTGETLKSEAKIKEIIFGGTKNPSEAQELEVHQLMEYYKKLRSDALEWSNILENPMLKNPSFGKTPL